MSHFAGTISVTRVALLADAIVAAGGPAMGPLKTLKIRTSDTVYLKSSTSGDDHPGTKQVETNTVVAAAGITTDGNAKSVVTAAGMPNSPKTVTVPVTIAEHSTAALIAAAFRTALAADTDVAGWFTIGGSGADVVGTAKVAAANDATMNITIEDDTSVGITDDTTSTNTTAGALNQGFPLDDTNLELDGGLLDPNTTWLFGTSTAISVFAVD